MNNTMMSVRTLTSRIRHIPSLRRGRIALKSFQSLSTATASISPDEEAHTLPPPLISFENATLAFPEDQKSGHRRWSMKIQNPSAGGHAVLGRNGTGKSLLSSTLANHTPPIEDDNPYNNPYIRDGSFITSIHPWYSSTVAHVSFESHQALLAEGGTAYKAITGSGRGLLSKAAQFLVVRFGLYSLIHRDVNTLSTGEIRKVLFIRALAQRPRLLVLDNAFDGLDVDSREALKEIVSKTIKGFTLDLLVQGISAKATAHTQVLLMTHRPEELVEEIETVSILSGESGSGDSMDTFARDERPGEDLMQLISHTKKEEDRQTKPWSGEPWSDPSLPAEQEIQEFWNKGRELDSESNSDQFSRVKIQDLSVVKDDSELLHQINWDIEKGQNWLVGGGNGAGKSTVSRVLAKDNTGIASGSLQIMGQEQHTGHSTHESGQRKHVGWVSTELHMATAHSTQSARQVLEQGSTSPELAAKITSWLQLDGIDMNQKFASLSQGQQKMILIGAALALRPAILVLDEPCQGLDFLNRNRVLGLVELFCRSTDISLVYITHHLEELLPSVSHVIHMKKGKAVYQGLVEGYDPKAAEKE